MALMPGPPRSTLGLVAAAARPPAQVQQVPRRLHTQGGPPASTSFIQHPLPSHRRQFPSAQVPLPWSARGHTDTAA